MVMFAVPVSLGMLVAAVMAGCRPRPDTARRRTCYAAVFLVSASRPATQRLSAHRS